MVGDNVGVIVVAFLHDVGNNVVGLYVGFVVGVIDGNVLGEGVG